MKRQDLYEAVGHTDDEILERSEQNKRKNRRRVPRWAGIVAAVLMIAIAGVGLLHPGGSSLVVSAYAVEQASYPEMARYPDERARDFEEQYAAWEASREEQQRKSNYNAEGLDSFFAASIPQFLSDSEGENRVYSPINVYMALGMLAELTEGSSRQQILDLLGADSIEALRKQANGVWNAHYHNDGATTSILANSLWMNQDISFVPETMKTLAENYYVSSYQGEMGSEKFNQALRKWLNEQTGGLLKRQIKDMELGEDDILALASTIYFRAKWSREFSKDETQPGVFHAAAGDITCDFMHSRAADNYYWADHFSAVGQYLKHDGGTMWFLLPDEGVPVEDLLHDPQTMEFLQAPDDWENQKYLRVNRAIPKFDVVSEIDLKKNLQAMGVTDIFDPKASDFSPMTRDADGIAVSQAPHGVRVKINEEGVVAAAYITLSMEGASAPPDKDVDFVLDRPFLFAVVSDVGLPLFVGVVNHPGA